MTDRGDGELEIHPGDPWHPGWSDDVTTELPAATPVPEKPPKHKRQRFGRKHRDRDTDTPVEEWTDDAVREDDTPEPVNPGDEFVAPPISVVPVPAAEERPTVAAPMPAWLSDPPRPERDAVLPVELPAWIGGATGGAEDVAAEFVEPVAPVAPSRAEAERAAMAEAERAAMAEAEREAAREATRQVQRDAERLRIEQDLAAALSALGGAEEAEIEVGPTDGVDDIADVAVSSEEAFEALRRLEGGEPSAPLVRPEEAFEALRRLEDDAGVSQGVYGVAGKEAFAALGDDLAGDDLSEWKAFAEMEDTAPPVPPPSRPRAASPEPVAEPMPAIADPAAFDEWEATEAPREKRGFWPFRRRRRDEEVAAEVPAEWEDDGTQIPGSWFPEVDEDAVVPPTAELPEVEWPVAQGALEFEASDDQVPAPPSTPPPGVRDELRARREASSRPGPVPIVPLSDEVGDEDGADVEWGAASDAPEFEEAVPRREAALPDPAPAAIPPLPDDGFEDAEDLQAAGPWRLEFDDGTADTDYGVTAYDPVAPSPVRGDRDNWEEADPDATVEMADPSRGFPDDIYGGSVTTEHRGLAEEIFRLSDEDTEWQAMSAAMPGVETGVVGFEDVADLSTGEEYREGPRSDLGVRVGTGLLLMVFLLGSMFVGGGAMAVFIGAMAMLGIWEFYGTLRRLEFRPLGAIGYLGAAGMLAASWFHGPVAIPVALVGVVVLAFFVYAFSPLREDALANGGLTVLGAAWVAGTIAFAFPMLRQEDFRVLVMAIVAATVAMDIGAYAFGRTWGKRALSPVLSPNKSIEGLVGGVLMAMGVAVAFGSLAEPFDMASGIALGAVIAVMAPLGDLAESMVKRSLGVKDMGTILPGHGGVLDRIDGFLFVLPAAWVLYQVTGLLG